MNKTIKPLLATAMSLLLVLGTAFAGGLSDFFDETGSFYENTQIVVGSNAAAHDVVGSLDIMDTLRTEAQTCEVTTDAQTEITGDTFQFSKSSDLLELYEPIGDVVATLTDDDLDGLESGRISTSEGTTDYNQYLRFEEAGGEIPSCTVVYGENEDNDVGVYLFCEKKTAMFEYELEFSEGLESDIDGNDLEDLEGETLTILGNDYTFSQARVDTTTGDISLEFLGGSVEDTLEEGETKTYSIDGKDYTVYVLIIEDDDDEEDREVLLVVNDETIDELQEGETDTLSDGLVIGVRDILVNEVGEGSGDLVQLFLGANKLELEDKYNDNAFSSNVEINEENIEDAFVKIKGFQNGDTFEITTIKYRLEADPEDSGDLYVPAGNGVREYLDEPEGMLGDFDIHFVGLEDTGSSEFSIDRSGEEQYDLSFTNVNGKEYDIPLIHRESFDRFGDDEDELFLREAMNSSDYIIPIDASFVLTDANDETGITHVLIYDNIDASNNEIEFQDENGDSLEYTFEGTLGVDATGEIIAGGNTFTFYIGNESEEYPLAVDLTNDGVIDGSTASIVIEGGGIVDLSFRNSQPVVTLTTLSSEFDEVSGDEVIVIGLLEDGNEVDLDVLAGVDLFDESGDDDDQFGMTRYGVLVHVVENDNSPDELSIEYPLKQRGADVQVFMGDTQVTSSNLICTAYTGDMLYGLDVEAESFSDRIISIGGPCVNIVSAQLLGFEDYTCGIASGLNENEWKIDTVGTSVVIYGWSAEDTLLAVESFLA